MPNPNEPLREKIITILRKDQTVHNATDLPDETVYEVMFGDKADAIMQLIADAQGASNHTEDDVVCGNCEYVLEECPICGKKYRNY